MPVRLGLEFVWIPAPAIVAELFFAPAERAQQLDEPMKEATEIVATEIDLNFEVEGRPTHWAPLAPGTIQTRVMGDIKGVGGTESFREGTSEFQERIFGGFASAVKILTRTGTLREGATNPDSWAIGGSGQDVVAALQDPTGYGGYHIEGTSKMPQRDYTYISEAAQDEIENLFIDFISTPEWS
jgi:phage gpG-like protein